MTILVDSDRLTHAARMVPFIEGVASGEEEPCCEFVTGPDKTPACDRSAEWVARTRCCGVASLACDQCLALFLAAYGGEPVWCEKGHRFDGPREMYTCTRL